MLASKSPGISLTRPDKNGEGIDDGIFVRTDLDAARTRLGAAALEARLTQPRSPGELKAVGDDRYLSQMSLRIFRAGLKHSLVDAKWPAFEEVFANFEPRRVRAMSDEALEALLGDRRLIRHWDKLKSVRDNAAAMIGVAEEYAASAPGSPTGRGPTSSDCGRRWPSASARWAAIPARPFLRMVGKDTFVLTHSVTAALKRWGAADTPPKNRKDRAAVQACFNAWAAETGRPLCQLSLIIAASVED